MMTIKKLYKTSLLFIIGGAIYLLLEMAWLAVIGSPPTHFAMFFVGGLSFVLIGGINEKVSVDLSFIRQILVGAAIILLVEFINGCILNLWLGLGVWDYSDKPFNLFGQICPQFVIVWVLLSVEAIVLNDYLRHWIFGEEKPNYRKQEKENHQGEKRTEFSKILVTWAMLLTTLCVAISYVLSFTEHDPTSDVTVTVLSACIAIAVSYEAKSFGEKNSRNKHGIDKDGNKITQETKDNKNALG